MKLEYPTVCAIALEGLKKWANTRGNKRFVKKIEGLPVGHDIAIAVATEICRVADVNGGWISVEERLPDESGKYLCYLPQWGHAPGYPMVLHYDASVKTWTVSNTILPRPMDWWMPLPEPPE